MKVKIKKIFEIDSDGKSQLKNGVDLGKYKEVIIQAQKACPAQAIEIEE